MACDLNAPNFDAPTFDAVSGTGIKYVFFNPIPQGATGQDAIDNAANDLAVASVGSQRSCIAWPSRQVQQLVAANCFDQGSVCSPLRST
jgi:hypothetical protein